MAYELKGFPQLWRCFTASSKEREVSSYLDLNGFGDAWNRALTASEKGQQKERKQSAGLHQLDDFAPAWETLVQAGIQKFSGKAGAVVSKSQSRRSNKQASSQTQQQQQEKTNKNQQLSKQQTSRNEASFPDWLVNLEASEFVREQRQTREADLSDFSAFWDVSTGENKTARQGRDKNESRVTNERRTTNSKNLNNARASAQENNAASKTVAVRSSSSKAAQSQRSDGQAPRVNENALTLSGRFNGHLNKLNRGIASSSNAGAAVHNEHRDGNEQERRVALRGSRNNASASGVSEFSKERVTAAIFYLANAGLGQWASPLLREAASRNAQAFGATAVFLSEVARRAKFAHAIGKFDSRTHRIPDGGSASSKIQLASRNGTALRGQSQDVQRQGVQELSSGSFRSFAEKFSGIEGNHSSFHASTEKQVRSAAPRTGELGSQRSIAGAHASSIKFNQAHNQLCRFVGRQQFDQLFGAALERVALIAVQIATDQKKNRGQDSRSDQHLQNDIHGTFEQQNHLRKSIAVEEHQLSSITSKKIKSSSCDMSERCGYMKQSGSRFINVKVRKHSIFHKP
jgi:hypothetical protein